MIKMIKKYQIWLLVSLIILGMGMIVSGGVRYIVRLQNNLRDNAIQEVMNVALQQRQAFDNFISDDRSRLHSYAEYLSRNDHGTPENLEQLLGPLKGIDADCSVTCLDEGWSCSSKYNSYTQVDVETLDLLRSLTGSGVRDDYIGRYSRVPEFCYYESFTFKNGHAGLLEKSYDRSKVSETFSLSFYNDQGFGYILDQKGDILLRSTWSAGAQVYQNVFAALSGENSPQEEIDALAAALTARETGSMVFDGDNGRFVYAYVPLTSVEGWYLLSIIPAEIIREEADRMLQDTQATMEFLGLTLLTCCVFFLLIWHTQKDIKAKDWAAKYQARLFDVFASCLSGNLDDVYMMLDHHTEKPEFISPNVERVLGVKPEDLMEYIGKSDMDTDPEDARAYYAEIDALKPGESSRVRATERINPRTGERRYFMERAYCADVEGRAMRVCYISDRTYERKTQESLSEALHMAQAANEAKTAFLSSVSHDIRTPMNAIIGFLALMRDEADNPETVREYTQRIDAASQHLLGLINDVLDMNKIESGGTALNISDLDLAEIIDEINTIIRPQARAKNQTFDIFAAHISNERLQGDKLRINQILINLLSNAVKYTPNGGAICLRVEEMPQVMSSYSRLRFTVSDNGLGMSPKYLEVIFDPFTREETKSTYGIQGTGLGMAITKNLVDLMGGAIRVESELDKGSTFTVELELRIQEEKEDPGFWAEHKVTRMIVVDDDEDVCRNIVKTMAKVDVAVDYSTNGRATLEMMREARDAGRPYDLILLDWQMPNLNGLETARLIRKHYSENIPILLLTAYDWSDIEEEAREIGVGHFLPKPFFMTTFKEAIRRVMGDQRKAGGSQGDVVRGKRVLVVDDIEVNQIILVKILSTLGAMCDTAGNGQEALEKFEASQLGEYDLILMDVQMPVMDGYAATRAIRSCGHPEAKTIPIIAMTANAFVDDVRDAIDSGMDAHIAKPVQIDKLKSTIQQVLDSRKA